MKPASTPGELFKIVGMAIMGKSGGASGAVFGTFFMGMAKGITGDVLDASSYAAGLREGLTAVQARGGAKPGDTTMIDALVPAIAAASGEAGIGVVVIDLGEAVEARRQDDDRFARSSNCGCL